MRLHQNCYSFLLSLFQRITNSQFLPNFLPQPNYRWFSSSSCLRHACKHIHVQQEIEGKWDKAMSSLVSLMRINFCWKIIPWSILPFVWVEINVTFHKYAKKNTPCWRVSMFSWLRCRVEIELVIINGRKQSELMKFVENGEDPLISQVLWWVIIASNWIKLS